jgi:alkylation response protein AidB-like acyl-CoA dehydrogenase
MDLEFNEDQRAIRDIARDFAAKEFTPFAAKWDKEHIFPVETLKKAAGLGFASLYVKDDVGGCAMTRLDAAIIFEELAKGCPSTAAFLTIHNMVSWMIDHFASEDLRQKYLPRLVPMDLMGSYCLTEPGSGSDAASLRTKAVRDGDDYILNGTKAFISGGGVSDIYIVMARTGGEGAGGISAIIVEKGTKGLSFGALEKKMGWHSQPTTTVILEDCRVPARNLIGVEGDGFKYAMKGLDGGRLNIGACSLGGAQAAIDHALAYMKERKQFGKPLTAFQALQFKIADMETELEAARGMLHKAAHKVENGAADATKFAAMAKRFATDTGFEVVNNALQLLGGYGYVEDYPIEKLFRDLRVHQILEGTNEIMRLIIAREMLVDK